MGIHVWSVAMHLLRQKNVFHEQNLPFIKDLPTYFVTPLTSLGSIQLKKNIKR